MAAKDITSVLLVLIISITVISTLSGQASALSQCSGTPPAVGNVFNSIGVNVLQADILNGGGSLVALYAQVNGTNNYCSAEFTGSKYIPGGSALCSAAYHKTSYCTIDQFAPSCTFTVYDCPAAPTNKLPSTSISKSGITFGCGGYSNCVEPPSYANCQPVHPFNGPYNCYTTQFLTDNMVNGLGKTLSGPGIYSLCYTLTVDKLVLNSFTGAYQAQCYWEYNGVTALGYQGFVSASGVPSNPTSNTVIANQILGPTGAENSLPLSPWFVPSFSIGSPMSISTTESGTSWYYDLFGNSITCTGCSNGIYTAAVQNPTNVFVELASPNDASGFLFSTQYCVNPIKLPMCPGGATPNPQVANLPCLLFKTSLNAPTGSSFAYMLNQFSSSLLVPNDYQICAYEGTPYNKKWGKTNYIVTYPAYGQTGASNITYPLIQPGDSSEVMFWTSTFIEVSNCNITFYNPFCLTNSGGQAASLNSIQAAGCTMYLYVSETLFILALVLMMLGAVLYAGSSLMPGDSRGQAQAYGMGLAIAGIASALITVVSVYFLTVATGTSAGQVLINNSCSLYTSTPTTSTTSVSTISTSSTSSTMSSTSSTTSSTSSSTTSSTSSTTSSTTSSSTTSIPVPCTSGVITDKKYSTSCSGVNLPLGLCASGAFAGCQTGGADTCAPQGCTPACSGNGC